MYSMWIQIYVQTIVYSHTTSNKYLTGYALQHASCNRMKHKKDRNIQKKERKINIKMINKLGQNHFNRICFQKKSLMVTWFNPRGNL